MNFISQIKELKNKISGELQFDENLSKHSWFSLGGPAKVIFRPKTLNELSIFLKNIREFDKIRVLGVGSNTLIRDGGFNGVIIKLGKSFSHLSLFDENKIISGASALDKNVSNFALKNSLSGFEFLSCIPGTIGGGIRMNSGCYGEDISKIMVSVQAMDFNGKIKVIYSSDIKFSYRGSSLDNKLIFISATFRGKKNNKLSIQKKINNLVEQKKGISHQKLKHAAVLLKILKTEKLGNLLKIQAVWACA